MPRSFLTGLLVLLSLALSGCQAVYFNPPLGRTDDPALKKLTGVWRFIPKQNAQQPLDPNEDLILVSQTSKGTMAISSKTPQNPALLRHFSVGRQSYLVVVANEPSILKDQEIGLVLKLRQDGDSLQATMMSLESAVPLFRKAGFEIKEERGKYSHTLLVRGKAARIEKFIARHDAQLFDPRAAETVKRITETSPVPQAAPPTPPVSAAEPTEPVPAAPVAESATPPSDAKQ